jgi:hypothetical protein
MPKQPTQAVVAQGVRPSRVGLPSAQRQEEVAALRLKGLGKLAQVVQREPEADPSGKQPLL